MLKMANNRHAYTREVNQTLSAAERYSRQTVRFGLDRVFSLLELGLETWTATTTQRCEGDWGGRIRALISRLPEGSRADYEAKLEAIVPAARVVCKERDERALIDNNHGANVDP